MILILSGSILNQVVGQIVFMTIVAFQVGVANRQIDGGFFMNVVSVVVSIFILFIYCYFGESVTVNFSKYCDSLYESKWYNLSANNQKIVMLMIQNSHRPLYFHGFHFVVLNLGTFGKVKLVLFKCTIR